MKRMVAIRMEIERCPTCGRIGSAEDVPACSDDWHKQFASLGSADCAHGYLAAGGTATCPACEFEGSA